MVGGVVCLPSTCYQLKKIKNIRTFTSMEQNISASVTGPPAFDVGVGPGVAANQTNGYWSNGEWYPFYNYEWIFPQPVITFIPPDPKEWLRGFLADKTHLTKDQLDMLKQELGL